MTQRSSNDVGINKETLYARSLIDALKKSRLSSDNPKASISNILNRLGSISVSKFTSPVQSQRVMYQKLMVLNVQPRSSYKPLEHNDHEKRRLLDKNDKSKIFRIKKVPEIKGLMSMRVLPRERPIRPTVIVSEPNSTTSPRGRSRKNQILQLQGWQSADIPDHF